MRRVLPLLATVFLAWPLVAAGQESTDGVSLAIDARLGELEALTRDIGVTEARREELRLEIAALENDRSKLNESLLEGAREVQRLEGAIDASEERLRGLLVQEARQRASLQERRRVLSEVLAALQRLGFLLGEARYLEAAEKTLRNAWRALEEYPHGHVSLLAALEEYWREAEALASIVDGELTTMSGVDRLRMSALQGL